LKRQADYRDRHQGFVTRFKPGQKDYANLRYYVAYLAAYREMAPRYGVSLRDFDRANWQWSKDQSKTKKDECVVGCANENGPGLPAGPLSRRPAMPLSNR
jgi:hypothetical protein